ncbi:MAG: DNA polymerase III subunit delta [Albidovulum sp.]|nr:DNA polymerase III subunit delta [Albidovulum sp.]MDE0308031.1 DNA polymerase III subunit delta [Albidovulum sp.]MDE0533264.1 DNA polymerase III subunit delta [Albidovulum sp.]
MKLSGREASRYIRKPSLNSPGLLIYGTEPMQVAFCRGLAVDALLGNEDAKEMRLDRFLGRELQRDPDRIELAVKAQGFFAGRRVVLVEEANEGNAKMLAGVLDDWNEGDAFVVAQAGMLSQSSRLRQLFEKHRRAYAAPIFADAESRAIVENVVAEAGLPGLSPEGRRDIESLGRSLDPLAFKRFVEKLATYKFGDDSPVSSSDIEACAPGSLDVSLNKVLDLIADGHVRKAGDAVTRLAGLGHAPAGICTAAKRYFQNLHRIASDPEGPQAALGKLRPPVFGRQRRAAMERRAQKWGFARTEVALAHLADADLSLRSGGSIPAKELIERVLIRIAYLGRQ